MILLQVDRLSGCDSEIVHEFAEDLAIRTGPRKNRLLMVSDGKHVAVLARELVNDAVLAGVEILELIDEDGVPLRTNEGGGGSAFLEKLGGLDDEHVEVNEVS